MPNFEVRVRMLDVTENDAWSARRSVEERLRAAGFKRWQIVSLRLQDAAPQARAARVQGPRRKASGNVGGGLLVAAAVAISLWFWWALY